MYLEKIENVKSTTPIKIKYDCCNKEHILKFKDADKNFNKNAGKHVCRTCWLKTSNPAKSEVSKAKQKATVQTRYGGMVMNSPENIEKRREKFKDPLFKQQWLKKHKLTSLKKYGVDHPMKTEEVQEIQKQSMQEKYGVDHPYQSPEIMAKMKANNLKKYGVENVAALPETQLKMAKTTLEKYGVEHYNQLPEMKEYLAKNCKEWLAESYANPWAKGITRPEEWNKKQSETMTALITSGEILVGDRMSLKGWYNSKKCKKNSPLFRSSYELITHIHLDENEIVEFYDYEPFSLPFIDAEGKQRHYCPDFIVKYKNSSVLHVIEVKSIYRSTAQATISKCNSATTFCSENGMQFELWLEPKIKSLGINYRDEKWRDRIIYLNKKDGHDL